MMGIVRREGFQLLSVSVTDKHKARTMGRQSFMPSDCLVVKPTAGASDDKRNVSIILKKGYFRNWFRGKRKKAGERDGRDCIKKWKEPIHFQQMGPSKRLILFNLDCISFSAFHFRLMPSCVGPTFSQLNNLRQAFVHGASSSQEEKKYSYIHMFCFYLSKCFLKKSIS